MDQPLTFEDVCRLVGDLVLRFQRDLLASEQARLQAEQQHRQDQSRIAQLEELLGNALKRVASLEEVPPAQSAR